MRTGQFVDIHASADFLAPGAIETQRYQTEILDRLRRRFVLGQRINLTPATGQPSRYFEQIALPGAQFTDPRRITPTPTQSSRIELTVPLKALVSQVNFGLFDIEVNQQQGQFTYLEAKDLSDGVDAVLRAHDIALWAGNDTSLTIPTSQQYYGISGQIMSAVPYPGTPTLQATVPAISGSIVDTVKHQVALLASNQVFEVRPSALYANPLFFDLVDKEAKTMQLYFNKVQVLPGVVVQGIPTQMGVLPFIADPALTPSAPALNPAGNGPGTIGQPGTTYTGFILEEDLIEFHWLTNPLPRVFQLGLTGNLASQYTILKFGGVVAKGARYAHSVIILTR